MPAGEIRARWAWVEAEVWTERRLTTAGLKRHPIKTRIVDATPQGGFGYHFERGYRWPREKESPEVQRRDSRQDPTHERAQPQSDHRQREPDLAWLVRVF
jgi:hypothetical protein